MCTATDAADATATTAARYSKNSVPRTTLHPKETAGDLNAWLEGLWNRPEKPTDQQFQVLETIVHRITTEVRIEQSGKRKNRSMSQSLFDTAHGQPSCGTSRVIFWRRDAFENVLDWQHGVQFVCLAFQNTMAAQIAGEPYRHGALHGSTRCKVTDGILRLHANMGDVGTLLSAYRITTLQ